MSTGGGTYKSVSLSSFSSIIADVAGAMRVTYVSASGQVLSAFIGQSAFLWPALNFRHRVQPACLSRRAHSSRVRAGRHFFSTCFVLLGPAEKVLPFAGGSVSQDSKSFFLPQRRHQLILGCGHLQPASGCR